MQWMRNDLEKGHWWTVGLVREVTDDKTTVECRATLATLRVRKKTYLNILTNIAPVKTELVWRDSRKPGKAPYRAYTCSLQMQYNANKYRVDLFNKMVLTYWRRGPHSQLEHLRDGGGDFQLTEFFLHAHVVQAFTLYRASSGSTIDHLKFRELLINELWTHVGLQPPAAGAGLACEHWPTRHPSGKNGHCQYLQNGKQCYRMCTQWCQACGLRGCIACLDAAHAAADADADEPCDE
jgi:hypothetical protein